MFRYTYTLRPRHSRNNGRVRPISKEFPAISAKDAQEEVRKIRTLMKRFGVIIDQETLEQGFMKDIVMVVEEFVPIQEVLLPSLMSSSREAD